MSSNLVLVIGIITVWLVVIRGLNSNNVTVKNNSVKNAMDSDNDGEVSEDEMSEWYGTLPDYTTGGTTKKDNNDKKDDTYNYSTLPGYVTGNTSTK